VGTSYVLKGQCLLLGSREYRRASERRHEIKAELSKLSDFDTGRTNGVTAHVKKKVALRATKRPDEHKASAPRQPSKSRMLADAQHIKAAAIEPPSAAPTSAKDIPVDLGAAA
jgi:hypothetical protein